ncbi:hypothetical protein G6F40_014047 [Rhizopus arrhizus]|nr:hypothetical protein G6F40_014047 [Rhizopus arrhizus]
MAWCSPHERRRPEALAAGAACHGDRHSVPVAAAVLRSAVPDRADDQLLAQPAEPGKLPGAVPRFDLCAGVPELDQDRGDLDLPDPADRLPDGLRHRPPVAGRAQRGDDAGGAAVVDLVPDPLPAVHRPADVDDQPGPAQAAAVRHPDRRLHRHRLLLPAVHGAAAVRQPGQARPPPAGGGLRPWCQAVAGVPAHYPAAVEGGHHRRLHAGDDSGDR